MENLCVYVKGRKRLCYPLVPVFEILVISGKGKKAVLWKFCVCRHLTCVYKYSIIYMYTQGMAQISTTANLHIKRGGRSNFIQMILLYAFDFWQYKPR